MVGLFDIFSGEGLREKRSNGQKMAGLPEGRVKMESKKGKNLWNIPPKTCGLPLFGLFLQNKLHGVCFCFTL